MLRIYVNPSKRNRPRRFLLARIGCVLLLFAAFGCLAESASAQDLPRRVIVGLALESVGGGVLVTMAPGEYPAAQAGIREGDLIRTMDGEPVRSQAEVIDRLRKERPSTVQFAIEREGRVEVVTVYTRELPKREPPGFDIRYGVVSTTGGVLRRTIISKPPGNGPFPAVVMLGGIGCYSLDLTEPAGYLILLDELTRAGYLTYWVEKSGMGDSEGQACAGIDFETELSGYRAGLDQVRAMPEVDGERIILLGHSMGGIIAPILAAESADAGVPVHAAVAIATAGVPWFEYVIDNARRQLHLSGMTPAEVEAAMREAVRAYYAFLVEKRSPSEIVTEYPSRAASFQLPHHYTYFQQVADISPLSLWARAKTPALLIAGGADYVTSAAEHAYVVDQLNALQPGSAKFILLEDMNHGMTHASDARAAWQATQSGEQGPFHASLAPAILEWLQGVGDGSGGEPMPN